MRRPLPGTLVVALAVAAGLVVLIAALVHSKSRQPDPEPAGLSLPPWAGLVPPDGEPPGPELARLQRQLAVQLALLDAMRAETSRLGHLLTGAACAAAQDEPDPAPLPEPSPEDVP